MKAAGVSGGLTPGSTETDAPIIGPNPADVPAPGSEAGLDPVAFRAPALSVSVPGTVCGLQPGPGRLPAASGPGEPRWSPRIDTCPGAAGLLLVFVRGSKLLGRVFIGFIDVCCDGGEELLQSISVTSLQGSDCAVLSVGFCMCLNFSQS